MLEVYSGSSLLVSISSLLLALLAVIGQTLELIQHFIAMIKWYVKFESNVGSTKPFDYILSTFCNV